MTCSSGGQYLGRAAVVLTSLLTSQVRECRCAAKLLEPLPLIWLPLAIRDHATSHYADKIAAAVEVALDDGPDAAADAADASRIRLPGGRAGRLPAQAQPTPY